ncbi:M24 family metallopeptidase [Mameliella alba]|uniref:M24 family metallopeptidase n=1 Tax=Mameliella alba TaxID=561184 RepID=UPI001C943B66|nr:M24 family metallopeptidase [Mameliella alba]MBY6120400.1 M24 family metallopeptidase [Mameliella alba]
MIARKEILQRQTRFADAIGAASLPGAVVFSRGGATLDRYGDIYYLTRHYQVYGYLPETPNLFSGRAHSALVINSQGDSILCPAVEEYDQETVVAGSIRCEGDFAATVAGAMQDLGLGGGPVGLVGADVLPVLQDRRIRDRLPGLDWRDCDELLHAQRRIKSPSEQAIIRRAVATHAKALHKINKTIQPGLTEADLIANFADEIIRVGGGLYFAAISSGPRIADWCTQGLPGYSRRELQSGDMVRFDTGIILDGYLSDFGHTLVAGPSNEDQRRLIDTVQTAVDRMIEAIRPGRRVAEAVADGEKALIGLGVQNEPGRAGTIHSSFPAHWGHGLGMGWERPMLTADDQTLIEPGMYLAVERTLTMEGVGTAAAEQTLLVTENGTEVLSEGPAGRWKT